MKRIVLAAAAALAVGCAVGQASAGEYSQRLEQCLVGHIGGDDDKVMAAWIFSLMAHSPMVSANVNITAAQQETYDRNMAKLYDRLLFNDCHKEVVETAKHEGMDAVSGSFSVIGRSAMAGLMRDKSVATSMAGFMKYMDLSKFVQLSAEAETTLHPKH